MASDFNAVKDIPGYKMIMKAILKSQIQHLVDQLSKETEEESVILTASMSDGMLCHLGSNSGKVFLDSHEDFKSQFLNFCLKEKHLKQQGKSGVEDPISMLSPSPVAVTRVSTHSGRRIKPVSKEIKSTSTPHGRRYKPYPISKPPKTVTSTVTSPSSTSPHGSFIEILPLHASEQSESAMNTSEKENETSSPELTSIKIEPIDSGFMALPDTIEGYRIVQNEQDRNDSDRPKTEELERVKETDSSEQTEQSELASNRLKVQLAGKNIEPGGSNDEIKPEGETELYTEMEVSKPGTDNNDPNDSADMSRLEQPGPSGISTRDTTGTDQRNRKQDPNRRRIDFVEDSNRCDESTDDSEKEISNVYLDEFTGFMEDDVQKDFERGDNELYYLVEHLRGTDVVKVINTLAAVLFTEDELIACSRTGKNTNKCIKGPRPPLDKMKLKKLERIVLNKTQISLSVFNEKLANFQKVLRKKRQARIQKMMGLKHSPNETI